MLHCRNISIVCLQEPRTPAAPTLPANCGFHYVGVAGSGGRDAGFLVRSDVHLELIPGVPDLSNLVWRVIPGSHGCRPVALASFWAPHVGCDIEDRASFWMQFAASIATVQRHLPQAGFSIAGDSNIWLTELIPERGMRPRDRQCVDVLRRVLDDFDLSIANPPGQETHIAGAALDLILVSPGILASDVEVHNGRGRACQNRSYCCPALGFDHFMLSARLSLSVTLQDSSPNRSADSWPRVRDWPAHIESLESQVRQWHAEVLCANLQSLSLPQRRRSIDTLYSNLCDIIWGGCSHEISRRRGRPQPSWWNDACFDALIRRNAAWRERRRNWTSATDAAFRSARAAFHHAVRSARQDFWESWLADVEILALHNPREGARRCRQQFSAGMASVPLNMSWDSGAACEPHLDSPGQARERWLQHFYAPSTSNCTNYNSSHFQRINNRVSHIQAHIRPGCGSFDGPFALAELLQAISQCHDGAVGPDGIPYAALRVGHAFWQNALLDFFRLVHACGVAPTIWKESHIVPLSKKGSRGNPCNYRPIALTCCIAKLFERMLLQRIAPAVEPQLDHGQAGFRWGADEQIYALHETLRLRRRRPTFCADS